jgi:hypothetical protein
MQQQSQKPEQKSDAAPTAPTHAWVHNTEPRVYHLHGRTKRETKEPDGSVTIAIDPVCISLRPGLNRVEIAKLELVGFGRRSKDDVGLREDASEWQGKVYRCNPTTVAVYQAQALINETPDPTVIKAWRAIEKRPDVADALSKWSPPKRLPAEPQND